MIMLRKLTSIKKTDKNNKKILFYLKLIFGCILFIFTIILQKNTEVPAEAKGMVAQIQMSISIYLTLACNKIGYRIILLMNAILTIIVITVIANGDSSALPGILIYANTVIVATLIYKYYTKLNLKIFEISENEKTLSYQNLELRKYNKIMEENKARLDYMANYDYLTNLPNRKMIINKIQLLIEKKEKFAVVFIDMDNFKNINDTMGHEVGDSVLIAVSNNLKSLISPKDMLGRLGGDELALIVEEFNNEEAIKAYLKNIKEILSNSLEIKNFKYKTSSSYGVSIYPKDGESAIELLKNADTAMYKAKAIGKNSIMFFTKEMRDEILKKVTIENNLKQALINNEIYMVFQPQYDVTNKKLKGFEALVRWKSKELGFVSPLDFIKVAEETGFIITLGYWIFDKSLKNFKKWKDEFNIDIKLSINISSVQIMTLDFVENIEKLLKDNDVKGEDVILEITESIFIASMDHVLDTIKQLNSLGLSIALDDFGTGFSSLSYLNSLPINLLKIDKSFIDEINKDHKGNALISSIIRLSRTLGISVIAEGVETEEQLKYLKEHKCNYIQGYLWGKPLNEQEAEKILMEENNKDKQLKVTLQV